MKCKTCTQENGECRKTCCYCGKILEGYCINNVSGNHGYRGANGMFYESEQHYLNQIKMSETKRIAVAGDIITIPENTRVIIEGGVVVFESTLKELKYKTNEWYSCRHTVLLTTQDYDDNNEFHCSGFELDKQKWIWFEDRCCDVSRLDKADPKEVSRLLIGEAEKRGLIEGVKAKGLNSHDRTASILKGNPSLHRSGNLVDSCFKIIFDVSTGKWAEIVKKPIEKNCSTCEFKESPKSVSPCVCCAGYIYWDELKTK